MRLTNKVLLVGTLYTAITVSSAVHEGYKALVEPICFPARVVSYNLEKDRELFSEDNFFANIPGEIGLEMTNLGSNMIDHPGKTASGFFGTIVLAGFGYLTKQKFKKNLEDVVKKI